MTQDTRMQSFQTPGPIRLRVDIPKGRIRLVAEETGVTRVELTAIHGDATALDWIADAEVAQYGDEIVVRIRKSGITLFGIGAMVVQRLEMWLRCRRLLAEAQINTPKRG